MHNQEFIEEIVEELSKIEKIEKPEETKKILYSLMEDKEIRSMREEKPKTNEETLSLFLAAKRVEGCSDGSIRYYESTLKSVLKSFDKIYFMVTTDDIRNKFLFAHEGRI